jgi:hypothetical protein
MVHRFGQAGCREVGPGRVQRWDQADTKGGPGRAEDGLVRVGSGQSGCRIGIRHDPIRVGLGRVQSGQSGCKGGTRRGAKVGLGRVQRWWYQLGCGGATSQDAEVGPGGYRGGVRHGRGWALWGRLWARQGAEWSVGLQSWDQA